MTDTIVHLPPRLRIATPEPTLNYLAGATWAAAAELRAAVWANADAVDVARARSASDRLREYLNQVDRALGGPEGPTEAA